MKLTYLQHYHLQMISQNDSPLTITNLAKKYADIRQQTIDALVARRLIIVRKEKGRNDRYKISEEGRICLRKLGKLR